MFETKFTAQEENKTIVVEREFAGSKDRVWQAWTDSTLLEKWWAPKPWKAVTKSFEFKEGGAWLYYMSGPEGEKHWSIVNFETIQPQEHFSARDAFCDENGVINTDLPQMHWHNEFTEMGDHTKVVVTITFPDVATMHKIVEMGFKEGFSMAHTNLDELLAQPA